MTLTPVQRQIKDELVEAHGTWSESWEAILHLDPQFLRHYLNFSAVPWRKNHLDAKTKKLICIAIDAAVTHRYAPGVRQHVRAALAAGATPIEIMSVLERTATIGIHAMNLGIPILMQILSERGIRTSAPSLSERQERLKEDFISLRGYWSPVWDGILELDPEIFEAYTAFSSHPATTGVLSAKERALVYLAFDSSATHLYTAGTRIHINTALDAGATVEEILEVFEIVSVIGIHGMAAAAPVLWEEAGTAG